MNCPRGLTDCTPVQQEVHEQGFFCRGHTAPEGRRDADDSVRLCTKARAYDVDLLWNLSPADCRKIRDLLDAAAQEGGA